MGTRALFLPGLDGLANSAEDVQEHLHDLELVAFSYPVGRALGWESLTSLVVERLESLGTGLLAGESFGGAVALKTAILHKQAVRGLVLLGGFTREQAAFAAALGRMAVRVLPRVLLKPVVRRLASWKLAGTLEGEERERFLDQYGKHDYRELARRLKLLRGYDVSEFLSDIEVPTDVIFGSEDSLSASISQRELWGRMPDARLHELEGYGHMICVEDPNRVARLMEAWAKRVGDQHDSVNA